MILEGCMIIIASGCLTVLHPGTAFQGFWDEVNFTFRKRATVDEKKTVDSPGLQTPPEYAGIGGPEYVVSRQSSRVNAPEHTISHDSRVWGRN
jgi:hypothetical protein